MKDKRTYADRSEYFKRAVSKRRKKIKEMLIEYKGGQCYLCGYKKYNGALDLHHVDGSTKEFGLGAKGLTRSWERSKREADKCVLVCANCHREIHGGITQLPEVILVEHKVNCWKPDLASREGNQQPSSFAIAKEKVQRLSRKRVPSKSEGKRLTPAKGDDIVHPLK